MGAKLLAKRVSLLGVIALLAMVLSSAWTELQGLAGPPGESVAQPGAAIVVIIASVEGKKDVTIAGSGFVPGEWVRLAIIGKVGAEWGLGEGVKANASGAFSTKMSSRQVSRLSKILLPNETVHTLKATGSKGSIATTPLIWE